MCLWSQTACEIPGYIAGRFFLRFCGRLHDGRYLSTFSSDAKKMMVLELSTGKWSELATGVGCKIPSGRLTANSYISTISEQTARRSTVRPWRHERKNVWRS